MSANGDGGLPTAQIGELLDGRDPPPDPPCFEQVDLFFSGLKSDIAEARSICHRCPYEDACLNMALNIPGPIYGVWGGCSEPELRRMRAARRAI